MALVVPKEEAIYTRMLYEAKGYKWFASINLSKGMTKVMFY